MRDCHRRAEVYLRTDTIGTYGAQQRVLDRIRRLDDQGVLDAAGVAARWDGIETYAGDVRPDAIATYEEFRDWADANDFSLQPAFDTRPRYVTGTTEVRDAVIFPVVAMAIYVDDDLLAVLPSADEFGHYTVHEALEGFERGDIDRWLARFRGVTVDRTEPRLEATAAI
jgi:hypothetical protein